MASQRVIRRNFGAEVLFMAQDERDLLEILKFELKFLEDGGYGRSPRTPWRPTRTFQDSPTCLNFDDSARPHPCSECLLMRFVPEERKNESVPCWFIPLDEKGETIDYYARCGTQVELEEALADWLRNKIQKIENERAGKVAPAPEAENDEVCSLAGT
jgi:hypothetical protein